MVRTYKKKRDIDVDEERMNEAVKAVIGGMQLRKAANLHGVRFNTLFYRVKKQKNKPDNVDVLTFSSKHTVNQVFTMEQEDLLVKYIIKCSKMSYGLNYKQICQLGFDYAKKVNRCPQKWLENGIAGIEWLKCFMKRHKDLSLRKPENTSLSRLASFNRNNVSEFQNNYKKLLTKFKFTGDRIYNLDETGVSTVCQAPNIVAQTGVKQVGHVVSGERGKLITVCGIINAIGNALPPVFIFPRARMHESLMINAPEGSLGLANSPTSGWMTGELFLKVLEHIKNYTRCNQDDPILVLLDNHESHCTLDAVLYCRQNGIVLCTFPPHCTHRLQPLDVSVMGPFKTKLAQKQNSWLISNPGKTISVLQLPGIVKDAFELSFTRSNITAGFKKSGIWPFDVTVFTDEDFDSSAVTDRPMCDTIVTNSFSTVPELLLTAEASQSSSITFPTAGPSINSDGLSIPNSFDNHSQISPNHVSVPTPESVRPYPKAPERKHSSRGRKRGKSRILTATPEKTRLENETKARMKKKTVKPSVAKQLTKRRLFQKQVETSSDDTELKLVTSSDCESLVSEASYEVIEQAVAEEVKLEDIAINGYILVKITSKKQCLYYVGQVESVNYTLDECIVKFLKKNLTSKKFYFPDRDDKWPVLLQDIVCKLPNPVFTDGTARSKMFLSFPVSFQNFKMG